MKSPYNRAKAKTHDRDLYDYKFQHTWAKRKKKCSKLIRARMKADMINEILKED